MSLIECDNITFTYDTKVALENLSFTVDSGDYLCIVGENGAGKTTLMKGLLGLKSVSSGKISFYENLKQNEIGYLPQQTVVQKDFPASVKEVVLSGCLNKMGIRPFYMAKEKALAQKNMELLDISDLANRCYRELSGGQQQRVLLARALCATQKLLLLDEPVTGLDPVASTCLYELITRLNKSGITVIMVSHDIDKAVKYSNKMLHIQKDQVFFGTTEDYKNSDLGKRYLGGCERCLTL